MHIITFESTIWAIVAIAYFVIAIGIILYCELKKK